MMIFVSNMYLAKDGACGTLRADDLRVGNSLQVNQLSVGSINAAYKEIGTGDNVAAITQEGSRFTLHYTAVHQVDALQTTNTSGLVKFTTTAPHNLSVGESITVGVFPPIPPATVPPTVINNIPVSQMEGDHTVHGIQGLDEFTLSVGTAANYTETVTEAPWVKCDRYATLDLGKHSGVWEYSTGSPPADAHQNNHGVPLSEIFFY